MKYQITISGDTMEELAGNLVHAARQMESSGLNSPDVPATEAPAPEAGKKKRGPKAKKQEPEESEEESETEDSGETGEEEEASEENEDDLGFEEEEEATEYTMDDLVKACQVFSKKKEGNKDKVKKLLKKYGVASVRDLKKPKFAEFMAALK